MQHKETRSEKEMNPAKICETWWGGGGKKKTIDLCRLKNLDQITTIKRLF